MVVVAGERYLVPMLGEEVNWRSCCGSPGARAEGLPEASTRCQTASTDPQRMHPSPSSTRCRPDPPYYGS